MSSSRTNPKPGRSKLEIAQYVCPAKFQRFINSFQPPKINASCVGTANGSETSLPYCPANALAKVTVV